MKHTNFIFITALILSLFVYVVFFPAPARAEFVDVPEGAWYTEAVNWCQKHGMINDGDAFFPQSVMTRAMVATALYRASGSPVGREGERAQAQDWARDSCHSRQWRDDPCGSEAGDLPVHFRIATPTIAVGVCGNGKLGAGASKSGKKCKFAFSTEDI